MFSRGELIKIRKEAQWLSNQDGVNFSWRRALYNLATAADHLDAMIARTEEMEGKTSEYNSESKENPNSTISAQS